MLFKKTEELRVDADDQITFFKVIWNFLNFEIIWLHKTERCVEGDSKYVKMLNYRHSKDHKICIAF